MAGSQQAYLGRKSKLKVVIFSLEERASTQQLFLILANQTS